MKRKIRIIASLLAFTLLSNFSTVYATNVDELRNEVGVNQTELDTVMRELGKMESEIQQTNNKIEQAMGEVQDTDNKITVVEGNIEKTNNELDKAKDDKLNKEKEYGDRLVDIYKKGKFDYLAYILSMNNVENIVTRIELAQKAVLYDQKVIAEMKKRQQDINEKMDKLVGQKDELSILRNDKQKTVDDLNNLKTQYEGKRNELNAKQDQYKNEIAELNRQIEGELAKQREEELARQVIQSTPSTAVNTNSNNNVVASNNAPSNNAVQPQQPQPQEQQVNRGVSAGQGNIASYASQFLGVPYVWGGTSPSGFDCSGLSQYSYLNAAGISIPRVAADQQNAGYAVSTPEAGDLVFFGYPAYHVGIYVGNGTMIHAPTFGDVVKYTKISYMSDYAGARRYR